LNFSVSELIDAKFEVYLNGLTKIIDLPGDTELCGFFEFNSKLTLNHTRRLSVNAIKNLRDNLGNS
jgi:hypothetical protein